MVTLFLKYIEALWILFHLMPEPLTCYHSYILDTIKRHLGIISIQHVIDLIINGGNATPTVLPSRAKYLLSSLHLNAEYLLFSLEKTYLDKHLPAEIHDFQTICLMLMSHELFQWLHHGFRQIWSDDQILFVLRKKFDISDFRPNQLKAIKNTLNSKTVIALFPTGYGKSLLYMLPSSIEFGVTLVFSPLCSLIADQQRRLTSLGINAVTIEGGMDEATEQLIRQRLSMRFPPYAIILITPEKFLKSTILRGIIHCLHLRGVLKRIVMDECHCLSLWGHSFRPSYLELCKSLTDFVGANFLCLTATADGAILKDLEHHLQLNKPTVIRESFNRPNLQYIVKKKN